MRPEIFLVTEGGEGKVLAGEGGPDDVAVVGGFLRADIVGPDRGAGMPGTLGDKAAAREEIDKGWKSGVQSVLLNSFWWKCQSWNLDEVDGWLPCGEMFVSED